MKTYCGCAMVGLVLSAGLMTASGAALADDTENTPLYNGPYATLLGRYVKPDSSSALDNGYGGTLGLGLRRGALALEGRGSYTSFNSGHGIAGSVNVLVFPFERLPGLYGLIGAGLENIRGYPGIGDVSFNNTNLDAGLGYLFPLQIGNYQFGVRAEALYEYAKRNKRSQDQAPPSIDLPVASRFDNAIVHIGLQLPFGSLPPPPPPPPPVAVVAPPPPPPPPVCKTPQPGERISLDGCGAGDTIVLRGVNFEFNQSRLTPDAKTILDNVVDELKSHPSIQVELDGHTDSKGSDSYNQHLSEQRAAAVAAYLSEHGVDAARMSSKGFGESMPVADNDSDEGREQNRRVEMKIVAGEPGLAADAAAAPASAPPADAAPVAAPADAEVPAAAAPVDAVPAEPAASP